MGLFFFRFGRHYFVVVLKLSYLIQSNPGYTG